MGLLDTAVLTRREDLRVTHACSCYRVRSDRVAILTVGKRTDLFGREEETERILVKYVHGRNGAGNQTVLARTSSKLASLRYNVAPLERPIPPLVEEQALVLNTYKFSH
jgi:hypothetical protein